MLLGSDILRLFSLDPIFLLASLLGVWCWLPLRSSTPTSAACLSALLWPTAHSVVLASLWVASSTLVRVPFPLPDTARFQVQESFVWFRAKTDSSALAACPHSATHCGLFNVKYILVKEQLSYYFTQSWGNRGFHTFLNSISSKVNVIGGLKVEHT